MQKRKKVTKNNPKFQDKWNGSCQCSSLVSTDSKAAVREQVLFVTQPVLDSHNMAHPHSCAGSPKSVSVGWSGHLQTWAELANPQLPDMLIPGRGGWRWYSVLLIQCLCCKQVSFLLFSAGFLTFLCKWTNKIYYVRYLQAETHIKQGYVLTGWWQCCLQRLSGTQRCVSWEQWLSTHQFGVHSNLIVQTAMNDKNQLKLFGFLSLLSPPCPFCIIPMTWSGPPKLRTVSDTK